MINDVLKLINGEEIMKLSYKNLICPNCKTENTFICEEGFENKLTLECYRMAVRKPVLSCACGYCSFDFNDNKFNNQVKEFVNSSIYKKIFELNNFNNYEYLTSLFEQHNAHEFECASLVHALQQEFDKAFVALFKTIILKEAIIENLRKALQDEDEFGAEEIEIIQKCKEYLISSQSKNLENLHNLYENTEKSALEKLMFVEVYEIMGSHGKANKLFAEVSTKYNLDEDLKEYFISLLN